METLIRPGDIKKSLILWSCSFFLRISNCVRRYPPSKRNLIIVGACCVYLFFVVSQVGHSLLHQDRRLGRHGYKKSLGLYTLRFDLGPTGANDDSVLPSVVPTRSNVVYITLKSRRIKPSIMRGTVRPKLRRKARRTKPNEGFTQNKIGTLKREEWRQKRTNRIDITWKQINTINHATRDVSSNLKMQTEPHVSSIRIYSERAPPWFSKEDISAMRFLADGKVSRIHEVSQKEFIPLLLFESTSYLSLIHSDKQNDVKDHKVCIGQCGVIKSPVDTSEVFAFHLDRVLGLNRSVAAVSRKFPFVQDGQPCPVVLWDGFLSPGDNAESTVRMTWGEYQSSLKQRCWNRNVTPKPNSGCSSIHHYEWSKLALFDFLLQIYSRLDRNCCGFRPRQEDVCVEQGHHLECGDMDSLTLANIIHRGHDPRHLVFTENKGFFDRDEDNLDYRLLQGIKELPEQAVAVLMSQRLREKLLQSLFLDQLYWESQGGRQGIEKLIDVIERRAQVLLTYINAHGIKVVPMNV
ncbi:Golgi-associated kinase 1B [Salmo salar]|uniref:Golgi-associated kinase 1B n=1 Tax=Salmo salar TaxID=8030 RepID=A0A1S3RR26_SALSA|nr:Golgi-associated kinase 1B [Salmo salar]|eukprot:XP_014054698.1 PREDICTED: protein FAM198B [Salmo salar]